MHFLKLCVVLAAMLGVCQSQGCMRRNYGHGSVVCVCNSTYCDTYPPPLPTLPHQFTVITTSKDGKRLDLQIKNLTDQCGNPNATSIKLFPTKKYQIIDGFGVALTDATADNLNQLTPQVANCVMQSAFSAYYGNGYTMTRIPLGGSDFSATNYTNADTPSNCTANPRNDLRGFGPRKEDYAKIKLAIQANNMAEGRMTPLGSIWSPPAWMKDSNSLVGGQLRKECYAAYATYYQLFLETYLANGVKISALTTTNEAFLDLIFGAVHLIPFNSMGWEPLALGYWITNYFCKTINCSDISIFAWDDQRPFIPTATILDSLLIPGLVKTITGVAIHTYTDPVVPALFLDVQKAAFPGKKMWCTETSCTPGLCGRASRQPVILGDWTICTYYTKIIMENLQHSVNAWIDWNLALDLTGGPNWANNKIDATIIVNATANEFYKQSAFYCIAQFSKYVRPGAYRIDSTITRSGPGICTIDHVAFVTPKGDETVTVLHNNCPTGQNVCIDVSGGVQTATIMVDPYSINTVIMTAANS